jgi:predicted O-methyltransferase YrrM
MKGRSDRGGLTELPATDPTGLLRYRDGIYAADFLACAIVHLDLFSWLAQHPSTADEICAHFGIHERPTDVMLTLCRANGLLEWRDGRWEPTALAREFLVGGSRWSLGPYFASLENRPVVRDVLAVLRSGKPANWATERTAADWHGAMEDRAFAEVFTAAMDCRGVFLGQKLAAKVDFRGCARLLDLGGGSGIYACCVAAVHPELRATVLEKRPVTEIAARCIAERGLRGRVAVVEGDLFGDAYPERHDVHLLSNVLHDWDLPEVERILRTSFEALAPGGLLVAHEAFLNAEKSGPLPVAEYSAILATITQGRCYGVGEIESLLSGVGFAQISVVETAADRSAIMARKRP